MNAVKSASLLDEVTYFLNEEAHLLDYGHFKQWLTLFHEQGYYWMPISPDDTERETNPAIFDADKTFLEIIINRLYLNNAYSFIPQHRFCRMISNINITGHNNDVIDVRSKLTYHEYRMLETSEDDQRTLAGTVYHKLVRNGPDFLILAKRVDLIQSEAALSAISAPI